MVVVVVVGLLGMEEVVEAEARTAKQRTKAARTQTEVLVGMELGREIAAAPELL